MPGKNNLCWLEKTLLCHKGVAYNKSSSCKKSMGGKAGEGASRLAQEGHGIPNHVAAHLKKWAGVLAKYHVWQFQVCSIVAVQWSAICNGPLISFGCRGRCLGC